MMVCCLFLLAGLDNTLKMFDFNASAETIVGSHEAPIRCVDYCADVNVIVTGMFVTLTLTFSKIDQ